jgi:7-cyano-7-deazaguanine synthase
VLLSGGLDSATTLALALAQGYAAHALTVRYGQRHALEVDYAVELARSLGATSHRIMRVELGPLGSALTSESVAVPKKRLAAEIGRGVPATYVPARNTLFLALALAWAEELGAFDLFLGANALDYSGYPDCRPEFLEAFEKLAGLATKAGIEGGRFRVHAPLLRMSKAEIVQQASSLGIDLSRTLSCYDPGSDGRPCRSCDACLLRSKGFQEAGLEDPALGRFHA